MDTKIKTKVCKQCGELKPIDQFRSYYQGRKGTYTTCKSCERINSRYKYLCSKESGSDSAIDEERKQIEELYALQRANGLRPPRTSGNKTKPVIDTVSSMIEKYKATSTVDTSCIDNSSDAPPELAQWLTKELTKEPEYYLDEVYEQLLEKYRPMCSIDKDTMLPVYDSTWRDILNKVLDRFNAYEDTYYGKE